MGDPAFDAYTEGEQRLDRELLLVVVAQFLAYPMLGCFLSWLIFG